VTTLPFEVFSTCPPSSGTGDAYVRHVEQVARWSEAWGYTGILVYTDNSLFDPWLVAHLIVQRTRHLSPLVAVQPVYTHPYTVAKLVASFGALYGRKLHLNMVAGGFRNDLAGLGDKTPHDRRYNRLVEYTRIVARLLDDVGPVSADGEFYRVERLRLRPALPPELFPGVFVSGSSAAGLAAARAIGAVAVKYPCPAREEELTADPVGPLGIRVGIIARADDDAAWAAAYERFPADRRGQLTHELAMKISDSEWHRQLSERPATTEPSPYWLMPFQNYKTFCPYLVGSYARVAEELARYLAAGYRTLILDVPTGDEECAHIDRALIRAREMARCLSYSSIG